MDELDKITEENFARMVEIIVNVDNEFSTIQSRMWAASSRMRIWKNEMADAREDLEIAESMAGV